VQAVAPDRPQVAGEARRAVGLAQENPTGLAVGSIAAGFLVGMILPSSRVEDARVGAISDDVKEHAAEVGQEALEHGKQVAQTAATAAGESAAQHGEQLRETAEAHTHAVTGVHTA
jgi:outer membrane murein-binding lipoprotein Lpp